MTRSLALTFASFALWGSIPHGFAATATSSPPLGEDLPKPGSAEYQSAREEFYENLRDFEDRRDRVFRLGEIAFIEQPGGLEQRFAEVAFYGEFPSSPPALYQLYYVGDASVKRKVLSLWRENWTFLGQGTSTARTEMVRHGLRQQEWIVRREAALLAAEFPLRYIGHAVIDAAVEDPRLTRAALMALRLNREWQNTRWALQMLGSENKETRDAALIALSAIGPRGKRFIVPEISSEDPARRTRGVRALLTIATEEDLSVLFRWLDDHESDDPALAETVIEAIAGLESGIYVPAVPEMPDLGLAQ